MQNKILNSSTAGSLPSTICTLYTVYASDFSGNTGNKKATVTCAITLENTASEQGGGAKAESHPIKYLTTLSPSTCESIVCSEVFKSIETLARCEAVSVRSGILSPLDRVQSCRIPRSKYRTRTNSSSSSSSRMCPNHHPRNAGASLSRVPNATGSAQ